jgi:hypothetical protein
VEERDIKPYASEFLLPTLFMIEMEPRNKGFWKEIVSLRFLFKKAACIPLCPVSHWAQ